MKNLEARTESLLSGRDYKFFIGRTRRIAPLAARDCRCEAPAIGCGRLRTTQFSKRIQNGSQVHSGPENFFHSKMTNISEEMKILT